MAKPHYLPFSMMMAGVLFANPVSAQQQHIALKESINAVGERTATLLYDVSDGSLTTGLGFRVHFDSSQVDVRTVENHLDLSSIAIQILEDEDDLDGNPLTDHYINAAWVDLNGEWPAGESFPVKLYSFKFDAVSKNATDLFIISESSSPVGFDFFSSVPANQGDI